MRSVLIDKRMVLERQTIIIHRYQRLPFACASGGSVTSIASCESGLELFVLIVKEFLSLMQLPGELRYFVYLRNDN